MYKIIDSGSVLLVGDGVVFPLPPQEAHGFAYKEWLEAGGTPEPADLPDPKALAKAKIAELEAIQIRETARFTRENTLEAAEAKALADFGIDAQTLYAMGEGEGAPPPAVAYRRLKDIDNAIKMERGKL